MPSLRQQFQYAVARAYHDSFIHGRLGRLNSDGTYTIRVPDRPTYAYVQMASEGGQTIATARNPGNVPLRANLPVRMRSEKGELIIDGLDYDKLAMVEDADPDGPPAHGIPVHHHRTSSGLEYEYDARLFEAGRIRLDTGFVIHINPFRYQKPDGTWEYWEGGTIDISSHQPATAGEHRWVLIGIDPSDNTATAAAGTAKADTSELTIAELDDIAFAGKIPCGAVRVREDDTDLSDLTKYVDAHGWHNQVLNQVRSLTGNLGVFVADGGQVGVGTTDIEAWDRGAIELGDYAAIMFNSGADPVIVYYLGNAYFDGAWKYKTTERAAFYAEDRGRHIFRVAASGTADDPITWIDALSIQNDGDVEVAEIIRAMSASGLRLLDDGDNGGVEIADGGGVTISAVHEFSTNGVFSVDADVGFFSLQRGTGARGGGVRVGDSGSTANGGRMEGINGAPGLRWQDYGGTTTWMELGGSFLTPNVGLGEAWNALSFNTGWGNVGTGYNGQYRIFGDHVYLRGQVERTSGSDVVIATLPAAYRPSSTVQLGVVINKAGSLSTLMIQVATNGQISYGIGAYANGDTIWLDGLYFSL